MAMVFAGTDAALQVQSKTEKQEHQINCTVEIRTPFEPLCLSIINTECLLSLYFIDTTFHCGPQKNSEDTVPVVEDNAQKNVCHEKTKCQVSKACVINTVIITIMKHMLVFLHLMAF